MAVLIDQAGTITAGPPPASPEWEDQYQSTMWAAGTLLTRLFGQPQPFGGWLVYTPAGLALIGPADNTPGAWDITGAESTLAPVARAVWKTLGRDGTRPRCGHPVNAYGESYDIPPAPCGRPILHPGPHRSPQALRRYSERAAERRRQLATAGSTPARDFDRRVAASSRGAR